MSNDVHEAIAHNNQLAQNQINSKVQKSKNSSNTCQIKFRNVGKKSMSFTKSVKQADYATFKQCLYEKKALDYYANIQIHFDDESLTTGQITQNGFIAGFFEVINK